jgi:hypothetical protein
MGQCETLAFYFETVPKIISAAFRRELPVGKNERSRSVHKVCPPIQLSRCKQPIRKSRKTGNVSDTGEAGISSVSRMMILQLLEMVGRP